MTGASGARYGLRLLERLLAVERRVELLISDAGREVIRQECGLSLPAECGVWVARIGEWLAAQGRLPVPMTRLQVFDRQDWQAPMASGSTGPRAMVVCPCSMGSLAAMAHGLSDNLIERAADVVLKEGWPLILVSRETPLSSIHIENMLTLSRAGAVILPACPGFYHLPETVDDLVDFVVERIMVRLGSVMMPAMRGWGAADMVTPDERRAG
ncbi:MAG: UbiX family flavin prenyltransferase [Magnetococcales bacterium]|nr:UbiX family flavin prenyltransferase [Magnetococcales bacterium]